MEDRGFNPNSVLKAAVIGCGRIGSLWDESDWRDERTPALTHATAYQRNSYVKLVALCDSDSTRLGVASMARGVSAVFTDPRLLLEQIKPNIVSLCSPPNDRIQLMHQLADNECRVVLCEKPIAESLAEARKIAEVAEDRGLRVAVNYSRRWDLGMRKVKQIIAHSALGEIQRVNCVYLKGLLNCGSHMIDLMNYFFDGLPVYVRGTGIVEDGRREDPTIECRLEYSCHGMCIPVDMVAIDYRSYWLFEMDILFTNGRIRISDRHRFIEVRGIRSDPVYEGYRILGEDDPIEMGLSSALTNAVDEMVSICRDELMQPSCTLRDGLSALLVVEAIHKSLASGRALEVPSLDKSIDD